MRGFAQDSVSSTSSSVDGTSGNSEGRGHENTKSRDQGKNNHPIYKRNTYSKVSVILINAKYQAYFVSQIHAEKKN
jgi:hypothetical protein